MGPRTNREILTGGKKYQQKQAKKFGVDEVVFDKESRQEYLTGFHKRKLERKKKAQQYYKEQERLAKIAERKETREEQQRTFEEQLKQLKEAKDLSIGFEEEKDGSGASEEVENDEWTGFDDEKSNESETSEDDAPVKGILQKKQVYKIDDPESLGDAVVDDETTVTVETLENPHALSLTQTTLEAVARANNVNLNKSEEILEKSITRANKYAVVCGVAKPKAKKKKFRYLTKSERHANNVKAKMSKLKSRKRD
ncbi:putative ribosomal RNA-processing protein [Clavispora lusitaniae]|uniref:Ribosomal RNA-processing protein n=1 Tax=Clavispora lusitaniae TaxID=36911 RepID=A0ACD0WTA7_CLALS|nr:pre-60S ribosomal particles component [Clavispora lusitaniae]KAF7580479.1 Nucleolar protein 12 (25kDa) family protein [Clavispora lusitaniae]QFZ30352.1 putative ribosomal RNA-processing protein [Clavispora lusitaniae]QFZ36014.1 putative ribosomal RNA-processing protein [Clavispora lusitaniae]QFZ41698.1 putative ribosomal RNA-processing protein [Clavispora lusitaniae]